MTIKEAHQTTLWFQKLEKIARARHEAAQEPSIHRPPLGARIRAGSKQTVANNPYMPNLDPGLLGSTSRGPRGYGPSNMVAFQHAHNGTGDSLPTGYEE